MNKGVLLATFSPVVQKRPFPTARGLSLEGRTLAQQQRIPSLEELLGEASRHNVSVMFDLRPEEDPQYERLVNITVETILQSGIAPELVSAPLALEMAPFEHRGGCSRIQPGS